MTSIDCPALKYNSQSIAFCYFMAFAMIFARWIEIRYEGIDVVKNYTYQ